MIRVLIADDQAVIRGGLRMILEAQRDIEVIGEAANGTEAVELTPILKPDVVLMDIRMPVLDGVEATRRLLAAGTAARVLVLTTYGLDENVHASLKAGPPASWSRPTHPSASSTASAWSLRARRSSHPKSPGA